MNVSITEIIKPIRLLRGSHADTGTTGQGCIMNVIAYLNGEPQITDQSPCVCVTVRDLLIWFNDFLRDNERHELIPYIERAMGSATDDADVIRKRVALVVKFAHRMAAVAARADAYESLAAYTAQAADYAASCSGICGGQELAVSHAVVAARSATACADKQLRSEIKAAAFKFFNAALPEAKPFSGPVIERAKTIAAMTA